MAAKEDGQSNDETSFLRTVSLAFFFSFFFNSKLNIFWYKTIPGRFYMFKLLSDNAAECEQADGVGRGGVRQQNVLPGGHHTRSMYTQHHSILTLYQNLILYITK